MGDQDARRDIINVSTVEGGLTVNNHPTPVRSRAEQDLLATVRRWVESRLAGQLHHNVKLNLQKQTQPQQVRPWGMEIKIAIAQDRSTYNVREAIGIAKLIPSSAQSYDAAQSQIQS